MPLPLVTDFRTAIFRKVVSTLRSDGDLSRVVKTWRTWTGEPLDNAPPTTGSYPWVRLTPHPQRSGYFDSGGAGSLVHTADFEIRIETEVQGTDVDDSINLWGAIEAALFPQDPTARAKLDADLAALGVQERVIVLPAWGIDLVGWNRQTINEKQTMGPLNIHSAGFLALKCFAAT